MAVRDRVRVKLSEAGALLFGALQPQPFRIGVVTRFTAGPPDLSDVLFENGRLVTDVPDTALERIDNAPESTIQALLYTVVRPAGLEASQEYTGMVVDVYIVAQQQYVLVRTRNGMYYEQRISQLVRVDLEGVPQ
jgi:hypothetical protein